MKTRCERRGQLEIGIIDHDGHVFAAFGSSINGHNVTGYTRQRNGQHHPDPLGWQHDARLPKPEIVRQYLRWLHRPHVPPDSRAVPRRLRPGRRRDALPWANS